MFSSTEQGDYNTTVCNSFIQLCIPEELTSEVLISFPTDNNASEGIEELSLRIQLAANTQAELADSAGNIFFQNASIRIRDKTGN